MIGTEDLCGMNNLEIAKLLVSLFEEYDSLKDEELDFLDEHPERGMWDEEMDENYDELCTQIADKYDEIHSICDYVKGL